MHEENINRLCEVCRGIQFALHFKHECEKEQCPIEMWYSPIISEPIAVHSNVFSHYGSLAELQHSAENGCHLCTLLSSSLSRFESRYHNQFIARNFTSPHVSVIYGATMSGKSELLRVAYGDQTAELDIVDIPAILATVKGLRPHFHVVTHTSRKLPVTDRPGLIAGFPLLEYQLGDEFEVLHVWTYRTDRSQKTLYLAKHSSNLEKPIGWIKARHHTGEPNGLSRWRSNSIRGSIRSYDLTLNVIRDLPLVWEPCRVARREKNYLDLSSDSGRIFGQIASWMNICDRSHQICFRRTAQLPPRVIDLGEFESNAKPRLVETSGESAEYLALSYRWGRSDTLRTTNANLEAHMREIPSKDVPQTIKDAFTVSSRLGFRYLWVDALCILQDSRPDWEDHAAQMDQIFANAYLVIAADAATDSGRGFLHQRNMLEILNCEHSSLFQRLDLPGSPKRLICPRIPHAQHVVNHSPLSKRGWILQERLLAKRVVHWTNYEIFWECNELDASERQPEGAVAPRIASEPWTSVNWRELRKAVQSPTSLSSQERRGLGNKIRLHYPRPVQAHLPWFQIVEEYSKRMLTEQRDRLPAISGLASAFKSLTRTPGEYVAGLWSSDFPEALLWRRDYSSPAAVWDMHIEKCSEEYIAPSFTWAACFAPIKFPQTGSTRYFKYPTEILQCKTFPAGTDPFGQLSEGWLKLRGPAISFDQLHAHCRDAVKSFSHATGLFMDDAHFAGDLHEQNMLVLLVRKRRKSSDKQHDPLGRYSCLLLCHVGKADGAYKRIGYYEPEPYVYARALKKWEVRTLTII